MPAKDNNAANNGEMSLVSYETEAKVRHGERDDFVEDIFPLMTRNGTMTLRSMKRLKSHTNTTALLF